MHVVVFPAWYPEHGNDVRGVFFRDQAVALAEHGHRIGVIAVGMHSLRKCCSRSFWRVGNSYTIDGIIPTYRRRIWAALPKIPYGNYFIWKRTANALFLRYVKDHGLPDLIHAHSTLYAGAVAAEWKAKYGLPVVLTEHSTGFARGIYKPWQLRLASRAAGKADACIAVSPELGKVLEEYLPDTKGRWDWIPNVVSSRFNKSDNVVVSGSGPVRFLNLALMTEKKGQKDLLEAFADAFGSHLSTEELWIGGDGPLRGMLEKKARELNIDRRVRFLGQVGPKDVPKLLSEVDVMVVASHYETFGVVAAEALMMGVPVVATRCGGPECIVGEGDGILVAPRNPQQLAFALQRISKDLNLMDRNSIVARAKDRFSGGAVARQLSGVYEHVLTL